MITFNRAAASEREQSTYVSLGAACVEELDWCKDPTNFVDLSNCDTSAADYDPTKCQTVYNRIGQNDCISRTLRNEKSACAGSQQPFDKMATFILEASVACSAFSAETESCVMEMSAVNPDSDQVDVAFTCLIAAAKEQKHAKNKQARKCLRFERVFDGRRKLKGNTAGFSGDNLLTGLCGCICPEDTCMGVYLCTHFEASIQMRQCAQSDETDGPSSGSELEIDTGVVSWDIQPEGTEEPETESRRLSAPAPASDDATARPTLAGRTFEGHNADGLLTAQCGCCPGDEDCLGFYECTQGQRKQELAQCAKAAAETIRTNVRETTVEAAREAVPSAPPADMDGVYTAVCGCICPDDTCAGLYPCTQGQRAAQLAQCSAGSVRTAELGGVASTVVPAPTHTADGFNAYFCGCCPGQEDCLGIYRCGLAEFQDYVERCEVEVLDGGAAESPSVPTARPTLAGRTWEGYNADGLLTALCGCICPADTCKGVYMCTQGDRQKQLAQCSARSTIRTAPVGERRRAILAEATAKPIISGMTYKGHNADGLLTEQCGCCPGATDCLGFYECNHEQRREELVQCAAGAPT